MTTYRWTVAVHVLMRAIVLGVLAGTAFFTALARFFWSAGRHRLQRLEQILHGLNTGSAKPADADGLG